MTIDANGYDMTNVVLLRPRRQQKEARIISSMPEGSIIQEGTLVFSAEPSIQGLGDYVIIDPNWLQQAVINDTPETATRAAHRRQEGALVGVLTTVLSQMIETFGYEWTQRTLSMEITALGLSEDVRKD